MNWRNLCYNMENKEENIGGIGRIYELVRKIRDKI